MKTTTTKNEELPPLDYHDLIDRRIKFGNTDFIILSMTVSKIQGEERTKDTNMLICSEQRTIELHLRKYKNHLEIQNLFQKQEDELKKK